jgi:hypothetical protein
MPSVSEAQRRLFGAVLAYKRGKLKNPSPKIENVAAHISESSTEDFARKKQRKGIAQSMMR